MPRVDVGYMVLRDGDPIFNGELFRLDELETAQKRIAFYSLLYAKDQDIRYRLYRVTLNVFAHEEIVSGA